MRIEIAVLVTLILCAGCDFGAKRRQAVQARRQAASNNLRAIGEAMHAKPQDEPPSDAEAELPVSALDVVTDSEPTPMK